MPLGKEVGLDPGHIVLDGDPAATAASPQFRPMPSMAKRSPISATAELLYKTLQKFPNCATRTARSTDLYKHSTQRQANCESGNRCHKL